MDARVCLPEYEDQTYGFTVFSYIQAGMMTVQSHT